MAGPWDVVGTEPDRPAAPSRPANRTSPAAQALGGTTTAPPPAAIRAPQASERAAAQPPASDDGWNVVETAPAPPAPPTREVGFMESAGRTAASAATPVVRGLGMGLAGVIEQMRGVAELADAIAPIFGIKPEAQQRLQSAQDTVFRATDERTQAMREMYDPKAGEEMDTTGQFFGGIASMPMELAGGLGIARGVERSADVVQRGGSLGQAGVAGAVTGGANLIANALPIRAGGAVGGAIERTLGKAVGAKAGAIAGGGLTGGVLGVSGDVAVTSASNAALPAGTQFEDLQQEASPAVSGGLGAALGALGGAMGAPLPRAPAKAKAPKTSKDETLALARKAEEFGIPLRPDQLSDNRVVRAIGDALEKVPLGGSKAGVRQRAFNRAVMDQIGADPKAERLTPDVFDDAMTRSGSTIGDISERSQIPIDEKLNSALDEHVSQSEKFGTSDVAKIVRNYVEEVRSKAEDGVLPGEALKNINSQLGKQIRGADGELKMALGDLQDTLQDALQHNISGEDLAALKEARRRYAIGKTIEPLVAKSATGDVSPAGLMGRVTADKAGKGRMARGRGGDVGDLARIGQRFLKEPPSSGTAERLGAYGTIGGLTTGAALAPGAAAAGVATIGAANLYNRAGPKLTKLLLKKRGAEAPAIESPPADIKTKPADPRMAEINKLREGASPEVMKVLDARSKAIESTQRIADLQAKRDTEAVNLQAVADKTDDPALKQALQARANELRSEKIPKGEASELRTEPATGHAPLLRKLPIAQATELAPTPATGRAPDLKPLPIGRTTELPPATGRAPDLPRLPVGKVIEGEPPADAEGVSRETPPPDKPLPSGEAVEIDEGQWRAAHAFGTLDADRAKLAARAHEIDPAAVEAAATQHAKSPRAFDRAIESILERKEPSDESNASKNSSGGERLQPAQGGRQDSTRGGRQGEVVGQGGADEGAVSVEKGAGNDGGKASSSAVPQVKKQAGEVVPVDDDAHQAATSPTNDSPQPTPAQIEAGNYAMGHVRVAGLDISIENPEGSVRRGVDAEGKPWESTMRAHYGYIRGTEAADGHKLDVFLKPGTTEDFNGPVFIIDQIDPKTGKFDEHKAILGAADEAEARSIYQANYPADWRGLRSITALPLRAFKAWASSKEARKPLVETK